MKSKKSSRQNATIILSLIIFSLLIINFSSLYSQEKDQKLYRIHAKDFDKIRNIEKKGISVFNVKPGEYIDILAHPDKISELPFDNSDIEFLSNSFKEQIESQLSPKALAEYHDYDDTMEELIEISNSYPAITRLDTIGYSVLGRSICVIKVSDNPEIDEDEPPILIVGAHHGNEILGVEATLYQLNHLVDNYGTDNEVTEWIDNMEIWFIPLLNPDGREALRRTNDNGVDLNRNYSFEHTPSSNHGMEGFSEPETSAIRDFTALYPPIASLTYHTSGRLLLYSWTHTDGIAPDSATMVYMGNIISESITFPSGNTTGSYELRQGGDWYFTAGEYCDYMYSTYNSLAFTVEMWTSQSPEPSVIPQVVERNLEGLLTLLQQVKKSVITGKISDETTGLPIQAKIEVAGIDNQGKMSPLLSGKTHGRYYRYIEPGSHALIVSAQGYETSIHYATTHDNRHTTLDISMKQAAFIELNTTTIIDETGGNISGNGNGIVNINETAGINFNLSNSHSIDVSNVHAIISSGSSYVNILNDSLYFGNIPASTTKNSSNTSLFYLNPSCPDKEIIEFTITIYDSTNTSWVDYFNYEVYAPIVEIQEVIIDDSGGNQNGVLNNGESAIMIVSLKNSGRQELNNLSGLLRTNENSYEIISSTQNLSKLESEAIGSLFYEIELSAIAPPVLITDFQIDISSEELYNNVLQFNLSNINGIFDNFETGQGDWIHNSYGTTANDHDDWQLGEPEGKVGDPSSAWSGENCWGNDMGWTNYQGVSWNGLYQHNVYSFLQSPEIDCTGLSNVGLKYKRWLNLYQMDYGRIKVNNHIVWMSPASGFTETEWTEHLVDISEFADNNSSVVIKFELRTNASGDAGGWNIDDFMVSDELVSGGSGIDSEVHSNKLLLEAYPNPFTINSTINYYLPLGGYTELKVIDNFGRLIKTLVSSDQSSGNHHSSWNGEDKYGNNLNSGIYYYQLITKDNISVKRIILIN